MVSNGENIDTSSIGVKPFKVNSEDKAGNSSQQTNSYKVIYAVSGLCLAESGHTILLPVKADSTSIFKQGSTIPVKFRVCDALGNSMSTQGIVTSFKLIKTV